MSKANIFFLQVKSICDCGLYFVESSQIKGSRGISLKMFENIDKSNQN